MMLCKFCILYFSKVLSLPVVGVASESSRVVEGVACRLRHDMVHVVQANTDTTLRTVVHKKLLIIFCFSLSNVRVRCCVEMLVKATPTEDGGKA